MQSKSSKGSNDSSAVTVTVDNKKDKSATLVKILASNKPGLLNTGARSEQCTAAVERLWRHGARSAD